jgi:hypothetical protein
MDTRAESGHRIGPESGEIDGYQPKAVSAFLLPATMLILAGVFAALPSISRAGSTSSGVPAPIAPFF